MKKIIASIVVLFLFTYMPSASAETKTVIKEYTYQASEIDSKVSCRVISLELVKRLLLEELGVYLESHTEVKNFQLTKDKITVLTAGIVRAEILDESWDGNTLKYFLKAKITVDPDSIIKSIDRIRNDQKKTKELEDVRKKADQAMEEIERLNKDLSSTRADMDKMKQYNKAVNKLSATDWVNMAEEEDYKYEPNKELIISYYEKAISLNPEYAEVYSRLGLEYWNKSLFADVHTKQIYLDKSIAAYEKAIKHNKEKEEYDDYFFLATAYSDRGYIDKAIAAREKVIQILLKAREVIGPQPPAGFVIKPILTKKDIEELSKAYRNLGYECEKKGDYRQAISAFNKAVELSADEDNYSALAFAYKSSGNYVEAINAFKKAIELSPKSRHYSSLGTVYKLNRNYDQAIQEFKNAIKVYPDDYQSYNEMGSCYDLKGNKKQAKAAYQKAYELAIASVKEKENFNKLSADDLCNKVISEFGKEKKSIWISRYLNRAIELRPDYALPYYLQGIYWLDAYNRGAPIDFKRAIELGLNNTDVYYWLGEAYYIELLLHKIMLMAKAEEIKDKNKFVADFNKRHSESEAISALNKAIELNPDYKNSYLVLGDIYRINGQFDMAQNNYKKAASIRKSTSIESDKYMTRYYNFRKDLNGKLYAGFRRGCNAGNSYACSWLSVTRE
jgi:tetratricopeptide (TPR) repeat protein